MSGTATTAASVAVEISDTLPSQAASDLSSTDKLKRSFLAFYRRSGAYGWSYTVKGMACPCVSTFCIAGK